MATPINPPRTVDDITPAFLTDLLQRHDESVVVTGVEVLRLAQGSTTHVHLAVTYADPDTPLPTRLFMKTQLQTMDWLPEATQAGLSEDGGGSVIVRTETRFYQEIRSQLTFEIPATYVAELVPGCQFIIVSEDLGSRGVRTIPADGGLSLDQTRQFLGLLAQLHAEFWNSPRLADDGDLGWIDHPLKGELAAYLLSDVNEASLASLWAQPFRKAIYDMIDVDRDGLKDKFVKLQEEMAKAPITLVHGDCHVGNVYFLPDGGIGLLDWQVIRRSSWAHDVGYAIINALEIDERREHERDLLAHYRAALVAAGVADAPSLEEMWRLYCLTPVWGLRLWGLTATEMYSEAIIGKQTRKFVAAYNDLGTSARLG